MEEDLGFFDFFRGVCCWESGFGLGFGFGFVVGSDGKGRGLEESGLIGEIEWLSGLILRLFDDFFAVDFSTGGFSNLGWEFLVLL